MTKHHSDRPSPGQIAGVVLRAVPLGLSAGTAVLTAIRALPAKDGMLLLGLAVACLSAYLLGRDVPRP
jgi:hypothetical protein